MNVLYFSADADADVWVPALQEALQEAGHVSAWQPGASAADYAVVWKPPQQMLDEQPRLKAIFNVGAGVDAVMRLNVPAHVPVIRLDDAGMGAQMAEYVCHALIRHFRGLDRYEADARQGRWTLGERASRADFPVGIMGLGVLGSRVAQAVAQFDFPVVGWSRTPKAVPGVRCFAGPEQLPEFLAATRVLVCLVPLTPDTQDILNHVNLSRLQPQGYVINVARGAHLVEADLLGLLDSGRLAGATLDVFRTEPLPAEHPFWLHPQITVTPHMSAHTLRNESVAQIARKMKALERGEQVAGVVDRVRSY